MLFPDGSNGDGNLPTADPGELLVSPDHHLKKQIPFSYLSDGPVSRSGLADGTRSFAMFLLLCSFLFISVTDLSSALALPMARDLLLCSFCFVFLELALVLAVA